MRRRGVFAQIGVAIAVVSLIVVMASVAAATTLATGGGARAATTATSPPSAGAWQIVADQSQPGPAIPLFAGAFTVTGGEVTGLHGITEHDVNRGCVAGEKVTVLGSAPIRHVLNAEIGQDDYEVSVPGTAFVIVKLALQGRGSKKHRAKVHHSTGELRIFFPGGTDTLGGFTPYSNLTYSSAAAGTCNLEFSITAG